MRIRERAFERVILPDQRCAEFLERRVERLDAAGIELLECFSTAHDFDRGALRGARFGEKQRAVGKRERSEQHLAAESELFLWRSPAQTSRDHEVNHEEQLGVGPGAL